nr:PREDICTED: uncharacterized protein C9orf43 homolog isoform X1 [Struthio camelus australis]XP_009666405.1 PREDICTED: uncharacterized protein C9orf43 homolog isoform X1 [Struthio camelus australis]XP_009666406.1 PREDICTED: uncharacterized protein C9orf43 homolog isoform X1 [Struthio camelus australis]
MTADVSQWDETICDKVICQHPQCWDTLRRIEEGHPRIRLRNSDSISRTFLESKDEFPTLKIVNIPPSKSLRRCVQCSKCHRTFSISAAPSLLNSVLQESSEEDSAVSSERRIFPGLNSAAGSNVISPRQFSFMVLNNIGKASPFDHRQKQDTELHRPLSDPLQVFHFPEIAPPKQGYCLESGNLIVKWVPNKHRRCQKPGLQAVSELKPVRQIGVKDLASESLSDLKEVQSQGRGVVMRRTTSRKVRSGGQPGLVHPKSSQILSCPSKTIKSLLNYKTKGFADKDGVLSQSCPGQLQIATVVELQDESGLKLMNRQPGLSHAKPKSSRPLLVQKAPVMVNLKEESTQRIRNSQYLKKPTKIKIRPDSMPLCLFSKLEEPDYSGLFALPAEFLQCCTHGCPGQPSAQLGLSPRAFAEAMHHGGESPVELWRKRSSGKSAPGKSSMANLVPQGVEEHRQPLTRKGSQDYVYSSGAVSREDGTWALCHIQGFQSPGRAFPLSKEEFEDDPSYKLPPPPPPSPCLQEDYNEISSGGNPCL